MAPEPASQPQPISQPKPGTLEFLPRRMRHKPDFPAISQHVAEINRMAEDGGQWSANALANSLYPLRLKSTPLGLILLDWERSDQLPEADTVKLLNTLRNQAILGVRQQNAKG